MSKRRRRALIIVGMIGLIWVVGLIGKTLTMSSSAPACSVYNSALDIEVHLSSGGVTCSKTAAQLPGYFRPGALTGTDSGFADTPQEDCVLTMNGQTATVSYGSSFGEQSVADNICSGLLGSGWVHR